eukprot:8822542-Pyramimonas_sp.AAC.1
MAIEARCAVLLGCGDVLPSWGSRSGGRRASPSPRYCTLEAIGGGCWGGLSVAEGVFQVGIF